jgi:hypothetical protein
VSFIYLLPAAGLVGSDAFDKVWVIANCDVRVIEGDVTVLAKTKKTDVNRAGCQQGTVAAALFNQIRSVACQIMDLAWVNPFNNVLFQPSPETRGMRSADPYVFIHVEKFHPLPVYPGVLGKALDDLVLRRSRTYDDPCRTALFENSLYDSGSLRGGCDTQPHLGFTDSHNQTEFNGLLNFGPHGVHHNLMWRRHAVRCNFSLSPKYDVRSCPDEPF